jgi:hypothetical protein
VSTYPTPPPPPPQAAMLTSKSSMRASTDNVQRKRFLRTTHPVRPSSASTPAHQRLGLGSRPGACGHRGLPGGKEVRRVVVIVMLAVPAVVPFGVAEADVQLALLGG